MKPHLKVEGTETQGGQLIGSWLKTGSVWIPGLVPSQVCVGSEADGSGKYPPSCTSLRLLIIWVTVGTPSQPESEAGRMEVIGATPPRWCYRAALAASYVFFLSVPSHPAINNEEVTPNHRLSWVSFVFTRVVFHNVLFLSWLKDFSGDPSLYFW